jgi:hypothetical protein
MEKQNIKEKPVKETTKNDLIKQVKTKLEAKEILK